MKSKGPKNLMSVGASLFPQLQTQQNTSAINSLSGVAGGSANPMTANAPNNTGAIGMMGSMLGNNSQIGNNKNNNITGGASGIQGEAVNKKNPNFSQGMMMKSPLKATNYSDPDNQGRQQRSKNTPDIRPPKSFENSNEPMQSYDSNPSSEGTLLGNAMEGVDAGAESFTKGYENEQNKTIDNKEQDNSEEVNTEDVTEGGPPMKGDIDFKSLKKGALRKELNIPDGEKIPLSKLKNKPGDSAKTKKRKNLAKSMRNFNK